MGLGNLKYENGEKKKNINFDLPEKEFRRLRYLKEQSDAKNWYEFLCKDKLDITKRNK